MSTETRPAPPGQKFRLDIQGIRAIAVLLVVANHIAPGALPGGYIGVDVFFVVSGYLITTLLVREAESSERISLGDFYARRARRILPAATVVTIATVVGSLLTLALLRTQTVLTDAVWATFFAANVRFAATGNRLLRAGRAALASAALLVARGGGAVLPRVAGAAGAVPGVGAPPGRLA